MLSPADNLLYEKRELSVTTFKGHLFLEKYASGCGRYALGKVPCQVNQCV